MAWSPELGDVDAVIARALAEDLATVDVTSASTVAQGTAARAAIVAKVALVACGLEVAGRVFAQLDGSVGYVHEVRDGTQVAAGRVLGTLEGDARALLAAERTALNLVQRMSGVASLTRRYVDAAGGRCRIVDTRKTTPGLRALERYAVRCGGGHNHRNDLGSGVLIKENHIRCARGIAAAVAAARAMAPHTLRVECEVTCLEELDEALAAGVDAVLLDNMNDAEVGTAVARARGKALVEVSGGITLARVPTLAATGVDIISVGALTHSAPAADISLLVEIR